MMTRVELLCTFCNFAHGSREAEQSTRGQSSLPPSAEERAYQATPRRDLLKQAGPLCYFG